MPRATIDNSESVLDSRDIIERIEELETERDDWTGTQADWLASEKGGELTALERLAVDAQECSDDWHHGVTLIRDDYFTEYTRELLEDCGEIPRDLPHYVAIDWHKTAENVSVDYSSVDFDGVTYWLR